MTKLAEIPIHDIVHLMPVGPTLALATGPVSRIDSATQHYNGPPVALGPDATVEEEIAYCQAIARYHISIIWGSWYGIPLYGHGVMYHIFVFPSGRAYKTRPYEHHLWHCANSIGNARSLSIHYVAGTGQDVTNMGWEKLTSIYEGAMHTFQFGREKIYGHREWPKYINGRRVPNSECPGTLIMARLKAWREGPRIRRWRIRYDDAFVREGPARWFPIANHGTMILPKGHEFESDTITIGETVGSSNRWLHRVDKYGFVHDSLAEEIH